MTLSAMFLHHEFEAVPLFSQAYIKVQLKCKRFYSKTANICIHTSDLMCCLCAWDVFSLKQAYPNLQYF